MKTLPESDVPVFIKTGDGEQTLAKRLYGLKAFEIAFTNDIVAACDVIWWDYAVPAGDLLA